jgi:hypothetical protein
MRQERLPDALTEALAGCCLGRRQVVLAERRLRASPAAARRFPIEGNAALAIRPRLRVSPNPMRLREHRSVHRRRRTRAGRRHYPYCSAHQSLLRQSRRPRAVPLGLEALLELKEAGKVRFIGMSRHIAPSDGPHCHGCFRCLPIPYSAVEREHEAAIATAAQNGAGIVIRGGAATEHQPKGSRLDCNGNAGAGRISMTCSTA